MAGATSPATGRRYGVARVCQVWKVPRSSFYAAQQAGAADVGPEPSPTDVKRHPDLRFSATPRSTIPVC